jgi:hypothetical protein
MAIDQEIHQAAMNRKRKDDLMEMPHDELTEVDEEKNMPAKTEQKAVTLDDYYMPQKVAAFCSRYELDENQTIQSEVFTEARLRDFFKAYPIIMVGDPLTKYLDALSAHGIVMSVTITGEPAIIVKERF